jgi:hypothetical protein
MGNGVSMPWIITPKRHLVHWTEAPYIVKVFGWARAILNYKRGHTHKGSARIVLLSDGTVKIDLIGDVCPSSPGPCTIRGAYRLSIHPHQVTPDNILLSGRATITCPSKRCRGPVTLDLDKINSCITTIIRTHYGLTP